MTSKNCLNCGKELTDKFCSGCGQKADTHRITFRHFIAHDVLHGTLHLEKGILFTAKQALIRPGQAALDYISGKRKRYYNVFYLILLTIGVMLFTRNIEDYFYGSGGEVVPDKVYLNEASKKMDQLFSQKSKIILLLFVPLSAFNGFVLFRRRKLNLSEHFILSGMILLGLLLLTTFANIYFIFNNLFDLSGTIASWVVTAVLMAYVAFAYVNAFSGDYTKLGIAYRVLLYFTFVFLEVIILFFIAYGFVSNWKFGTISVSPFG
ncbi:MAG: DUF3667 domain-containing protein [Bacteroidota bacterium]